MAEDAAQIRGPGVADIVRQTVRNLPRDARRGLALVAIAWVVVIAFHIWDAQDRPGPRAVAELASVLLGTAGLLLFGLTVVLRSAEEPASSRAMLFRGRDGLAVPESLALRRILLALPTLALLSGALLAAAATIVVVRVFLGTTPAILAIGVVYLSAFAGALRAASQAAAQLYAFGQRESARVARAEAQLSDARLATLQAQMNPHFLFNALNTVASLVRTDPGAAERTVENLSDVLRSTLQRSQQTLGTVRDEVEFVRAYLAIERQRFGERLSVDWTVDPAALDTCLPPLTIQPLVENALKHGIGHRRDGGRIVVSVAGMAERLRIEVADNGDGLDGPLHEGTGLSNLRDRLQVLYGSAGTLDLESSAGGTRVRVEVPLTTPGVSHARADR